MDRPGVEEKRRQVIPAHIEYLATNPIKIVMSGPLVSDDGGKTIGSLYMLEAANRAEIEKFQHADPLYNADIWEMVEVRAFNKRLG
ncbi:MAG: YciI family protein [Burkholderiales bacterium]